MSVKAFCPLGKGAVQVIGPPSENRFLLHQNNFMTGLGNVQGGTANRPARRQ